MNKYNNPRLLNAVVSGTGMKHPIQPHVVVGDVSNGFIRGDLMDANAIVDLVNSGDAIDQETIRQAVADIIGTAPENLDTLGEIVEALDAAVLDPNTEGSLANQISVINTTIEDNELTIAAALNDLNSRLLELVTRVDALDGGGDTPTKTLWKFSQGGPYMFGEFQNGVLSVKGPDEDHSFIASPDGQIVQFSPINQQALQSLKEVLARYFGEIETVQILVVTGLAIGDDVPNWEDYEQIPI